MMHKHVSSRLKTLVLSTLQRGFLCSFLSSCASRPGPDEPPRSCPKVQLLQEEGFTTLQMRALCEGPNSQHFLGVSHAKLASVVLLLKNHGVAGPAAGRLLALCPNVLRLGLDNMEAKIEFFRHQFGLLHEPRLLQKLITHNAGNKSLLTLSLQNMEHHLAFLREEVGMDYSDVRRMVIAFPSLFTLNVQRNLNTKLKLLQQRGLDKKAIAWLWRTHPRLLDLSENPGFTTRFDLLQQLGFELNSKVGLSALGYWSSVNPKTILIRFNALQRHGFSHAEALQMVQMHPTLLCNTEDNISKKIEYLVHVLKRDVRELLQFPTYLTYSLQKRIVPRFTILHELKSKGLLKKDRSLSYVLHLTNEGFSKSIEGITHSQNVILSFLVMVSGRM